MRKNKKKNGKIRKLVKKVTIILIVIFVCLTFINYLNNTEAEAAPRTTPEPIPTDEPEMINRLDYWKEHPEECPFDRIKKVDALARVADAVCPDGASDNCKAAVMACVWNRTTTSGFPNSIEEVANQPYQWEGMTSQSTASQKTKKLAEKLLAEWESGEIYILPIPRNSVFFKLSVDGIWFRSEWNGLNEAFVPYY